MYTSPLHIHHFQFDVKGLINLFQLFSVGERFALCITLEDHRARQMTPADYERYDWIVAMDRANLRNIRRIIGGDPHGKVRLLLDFADRPGEEVADPWYTGDFDAAWQDVIRGCGGLLEATRTP